MRFSWQEPRISNKAAAIEPSATLALSAKAKEMEAAGHDVIDLSVGQPDFNTPPHIIEAACRALRDGATGYTPTPGTPQLRDAVAAEMRAVHGLDLSAQNVVVSPGAKYSLALAVAALINPGDKVVLAAPWWVSYPKMVQLAQGRSVCVPTTLQQGFRLTPDRLEPYLDEDCRLLILNSPSNPTGVGYSEADLQALAELLLRFPNLWVLCDDIYRKLVYDDFKAHSLARVAPKLARRCVFVDGVSKAYAMTGWRIGYLAGPRPLVGAVSRMQGHTTSNPAAVSQAAALAALTGPQQCVEEMRTAFAVRRRRMLERLRQIDGVCFVVPDGAFYVFVNVEQILGKRHPERDEIIDSDEKLGTYLLEQAHVAAVPGTAFGAPGHLRLSYAAAKSRILEALERFDQCMRALRPTKHP
jgi:aspartate aminotransferase